MSDQYSDQGHKPQVIDLEAEEIRSEDEAPPPPPAEEMRSEAKVSEPSPSPPPPPPRPRAARGGSATWIIAALVLGALAGGWLYRGVLSNYLPSDRMTALKNEVAALQQNNADLSGRLAQVKQGADGAAQAAATASDAAAEAAAAAKAAAGKADGLGARLDQSDQKAEALAGEIKAAKADLEGLRKSLSSGAGTASTGTAAASPADAAALAALGQRIDALEKDVASLKAGGAPSAQAGLNTALSQALSDLKAKVAAGTAFKDEYERVARMAPAAAGLDVLAQHAADGVPNARGLAEQLTGIMPNLPTAAPPAPEDNSYFGMAMKQLSGIITVRPIGETDWRAVAQKAADLAAQGDLTQAISVIDKAEGEKPIPLGQWRDLAAQRLALEAATSQVSEAVLRQLAATAQGAAQ